MLYGIYVHTLKQVVLFQMLVILIKYDLLHNKTIMSPEFLVFRVYIERKVRLGYTGYRNYHFTALCIRGIIWRL